MLGVAGLLLLGSAGLAALPPPESGEPTGLAVTAPPVSGVPVPAAPVPAAPGPTATGPAATSARTPAPTASTAAPRRSPVLGRVPVTRAVPRAARSVATPTELRAPAQDLVLPIDPMGIDDRGALGIPMTPGRISWYRYGPAPGEGAGSAVFAGHVDAPWGKTPLYRIKDLTPGDTIDVVLDTGGVLAYRVRAVDTISKARLADTDLFRRDGAPVLRLVTCGGPWLPDRQDYRDNVVVTAEPVR
ncbi:hypothetical protein GCM10011512_02500 [Tersicoccus solisilvae]|uniref:Sortase n=1 Tax=Tersicoccus solisilvae TaxID=1882339 RepID=A0ABQ1NSY8_9MICC|nr:class F sortase [Tersicoccus solisilvae]GGC79352.1 hypothetical protein GCM10011512_02500 [Tersicoccus solisilvae]